MKNYLVYYLVEIIEGEIIERCSLFDNLDDALAFKDGLMKDSNVIEVILYEWYARFGNNSDLPF